MRGSSLPGKGVPSLENKLVAVPVFNEEKSVEKVLNAIVQYAGPADILVIDDGSTDFSRQFLACFDNIHLIRHARNLGYGQSLINAFQFAIATGYEYLVTIDCDEQHEPQRIPRFFSRLTEGWDIVSGSRYLTTEAVGTVPEDRQQINQVVTKRVNEITGFGLTDSFCGMKGYKVASLNKLTLTETGYGFPLQLWLEAHRAGLTVVEEAIPLIYIDNFDRSFGLELDDPEQRLRYYWRVINEGVSKCN